MELQDLGVLEVAVGTPALAQLTAELHLLSVSLTTDTRTRCAKCDRDVEVGEADASVPDAIGVLDAVGVVLVVVGSMLKIFGSMLMMIGSSFCFDAS